MAAIAPMDGLVAASAAGLLLFFVYKIVPNSRSAYSFSWRLLRGILDFRHHLRVAGAAGSLLLRNKWLFLVPALLYAPTALWQREAVSKFYTQMEMLETAELQSLTAASAGEDTPLIIHSLRGAASQFDACVTNIRESWMSSMLWIPLLPLCPWVLRLMRRGEEVLHRPARRFPRYALWLGAASGVLAGIIDFLWIRSESEGEPSFMADWLLDVYFSVGIPCAMFAGVVLAAFWFILLLTILHCRLEGQKVTRDLVATSMARSFTPVLLSILAMTLLAWVEDGASAIFWILSRAGLEFEAVEGVVGWVSTLLSVPARIAGFLLVPVPFIVVREGLSFGPSIRAALRFYGRCVTESLGFMLAWVLYVAILSWCLTRTALFSQGFEFYSWGMFWTGVAFQLLLLALSGIAVIALSGTLWATRDRWLGNV